jgi:hypothetical protein
LQALQKNRAPAFGTGRCVAIDQLLNGLAESDVRTETVERLHQLAAPTCCATLGAWQLFQKCGNTLPARTGLPAKRASSHRGCGQALAYPQDPMCRKPFTEDKPFFLHDRCRLDTILVQLILRDLNC